MRLCRTARCSCWSRRCDVRIWALGSLGLREAIYGAIPFGAGSYGSAVDSCVRAALVGWWRRWWIPREFLGRIQLGWTFQLFGKLGEQPQLRRLGLARIERACFEWTGCERARVEFRLRLVTLRGAGNSVECSAPDS